MQKNILSICMISCMFFLSGLAHAEQPKADEYRQLFASGHYYLEYKIGFKDRNKNEYREYDHKLLDVYDRKLTLGVQDGKRMQFAAYKKGMLETVMQPEAYYADGKYYQFPWFEKNKALMATEAEINDVSINPMERWDSKKNRLIVPQPLQVLAEGDKFGREDEHIRPAKLIESFAGDAKNPAYDKYSAEVCNSDGDVLYEYITYLYYKKGELFASKFYWKYPGREEVLLQDMEIIRLTSEVPEKRINLKKGCEVFKAGTGDIDDMLDHQVLLYKVGKENKDA